MYIKRIAFTALTILGLTLGTVSQGSPVQASTTYYGSTGNVADGGNG